MLRNWLYSFNVKGRFKMSHHIIFRLSDNLSAA